MSKDFAMLNAARKLESYLSREFYNLDKLADNPRIHVSLFETKVGHYNDLVDTLNDLFGMLTDSPHSQLFPRYRMEGDGDGFSHDNVPPVSVVVPDYEREPEPMYEEMNEDPIQTVAEQTEPEREEEPEPEVPTWQADGYASHAEWLADKVAESAESPDDLSVTVNVGLSQHRAEQALNEYNETSERDIATYLPEDDKPVNVLPSELSGTEDDRPTANLDYLNHTVDNVRVDNDPTQIAGVETAVERDGENARRGTDIDVSSFIYKSGTSIVDDLISDDIEKLQATPRLSVVDEEDGEPVDDETDDEQEVEYYYPDENEPDEPFDEMGTVPEGEEAI